MISNQFKKIENEAGYPCYIDETTGKQQYDHPEFTRVARSLEEYDAIKYSAYRIAFKINALQKHLKVPPLRLSSGVFARHQLSLSESSLSLDTAELEAVLTDIYFAAETEGHFSGDVDLAVDLMISLLLNVYDKERKEPIRVLAAKTLLIILSQEPVRDKWAALANCSADHNECVSPKRLASLLAHVTALSKYLGGGSSHLQSDVDACFQKNGGMIGLTSRAVAEWGADNCATTKWLPLVHRIVASREITTATVSCANCTKPLVQTLQFQCTKCSEVYFCERCYLYGNEITAVSGHKNTHAIHEIIDGQTKPLPSLSFIKGMKRFFFCTKTKKRKTSLPKSQSEGAVPRRRKDTKPAMFTSTVGKAAGHSHAGPALPASPAGAASATCVLQDIIGQLETHNKSLQDLLNQLKEVTVCRDAENLKENVDAHWSRISIQINRLKTFKDNLSNQTELPNPSKPEKCDRPQAFDLFSPILVDEKQSRVPDSHIQPRVLSLDSGNFSVVSKNADADGGGLLTVSGDALRPVAQITSDTISTVSMDDISTWYNEPASLGPDKKQIPPKGGVVTAPADVTASGLKLAADVRTVPAGNDKIKELNADLDTVLTMLHSYGFTG